MVKFISNTKRRKEGSMNGIYWQYNKVWLVKFIGYIKKKKEEVWMVYWQYKKKKEELWLVKFIGNIKRRRKYG